MLTLLALMACSGPTEPGGGPPSPSPVDVVDDDDDGWPAGADCDDTNPAIHPGALEQCNEIDDDCSSSTVEARSVSSIATAADGGEVVVCEGSYGGNLVLTNRQLTIRADGFVTLYAHAPERPVLTIEGGVVVIEGLRFNGGSYAYETASMLSIHGATVVMRQAAVENAFAPAGAGLYVDGGSYVRLEDTLVQQNLSYGPGGGIALFDSTLEVHGGSFVGNDATNDGGAIYALRSTIHLVGGDIEWNVATADGGGLAAIESTVTISGTNFASNDASSDGGAIFLDESSFAAIAASCTDNDADLRGGCMFLLASSADLDLVEVYGNYAGDSGGGLYAQSTTVTGDYAWIASNSASGGGDGGGIDITGGGTVEAHGWTIEENTATYAGGGIRLAGGSFLGDEGTVIRDNEATSGGGAAIVQGPVTLEAGTIRDNAADRGGGVWSATLLGTGEIAATIEANEAWDQGGGLYVDSGTVALDGALYGNTAPSGGGAWLEAESALTGTIAWGAGLDDNVPNDLATADGAVWSSEEDGTWTCGADGCE